LAGHRKPFILTLVSAAAIYVVAWVPFAVQQIDDLSSGDISWQTASRDVAGEMAYLANAPMRVVVDRDHVAEPAGMAAGVLLVLPWLLGGRCRVLRPWAIILTCTLGGLFLLDMARSTRVLMVTRY